MKYAATAKNRPASTPPSTTAAHLPADLVGTPQPLSPSILAHLGKVVGRKQVAHDLGISKSLLDQMIAGEKNDPIIRVDRLLGVVMKHLGADFAVIVGRDLMHKRGCLVLSPSQSEALKLLCGALKQ